MIGGFVRANVDALSETEIDALETVLEIPDTVLADWLTGREPIPPDNATSMLLRMKNFLVR